MINLYKNRKLCELPPHIFAIATAAYRRLIQDNRDQCVVIRYVQMSFQSLDSSRYELIFSQKKKIKQNH